MSEPGWYPDPGDPARARYWDGSAWTAQIRPLTAPVPDDRLRDPGHPSPGGARKRSRLARVVRWSSVGVFAVLVLVAGALVVVLGDDPAAAEITFEPVASSGDDPFMESIAVQEVTEFAGDVDDVIEDARREFPTADGVLTPSGTDPALYGGTPEESVCNPELLLAFLADHPDEAAAWASVAGHEVDEIPEFVGSLTSVVLGSDTWVLNHGFAEGEAVPRQSVLQAGSAVMADSQGVPRVRCGDGNPLLQPAADDIDRGAADGAWDDYDPAEVVRVVAGEATETLTVVDIESGRTFQQSLTAKLRFDGVGPLTVGMTPAEAAAGGIAVSIGADQSEECAVAAIEDAPGLSATVVDGRITRIDAETSTTVHDEQTDRTTEVYPGVPWETIAGIKIGDSDGRVRAAYGERVSVERDPGVRGRSFLVVEPLEPGTDLALVFETERGVVETFRAGERGAVTDPELCRPVSDDED